MQIFRFYKITTTLTPSDRHNYLDDLLPPPIKCLQRINLPPRLPPATIPIPGLTNPIIARFSKPNEPNIVTRDPFLPLCRHQILWDMFKMWLNPRGAQLAIVTQLPQLIGILLEVALQLLALNQFLADFTRARFLDRKAGDGAQGIGHTVPEGVDLGHVKVVRFDLVAEFGLALGDLLKDRLVVLCCGD